MSFLQRVSLLVAALIAAALISPVASSLFAASSPARSETPLFFTAVTQVSHVDKIAIMAVELAKLGYPITFVTGRVFEDKISKLHPNIEFKPLLGSDNLMDEQDMKTWASLSGAQRELFVMKKVLVDSMPQSHETMQTLYQDFREKYGHNKPLITFFDQSLTGHYPVLFGGSGIKPDSSIAISIAPLCIDSNDTYPFRTGKPPHTGPDAKAVHWKAYQESYEDPFNKELNEYWWAKLRNMGSTHETYPSILSAFNAMGDRLLTYGIPEFEFPRSDVKQDITWFGSLHSRTPKNVDGEAATGLPSWWDDIAAAKKEGKKIVVVGQGTLHLNPGDLVLPSLEGLKDREDVLVIATFVGTEPEDVPGLVVPKNTRVAKYVPYDHLLPQTDILISNGGYGAVQHALLLGIPLIVSGTGEDKADSNAIVDWSGVGINLGVENFNSERLAAAVDKVLKDSSYREKAQILSKEFDKYDVGQVFDKTIQEVVKEWNVKKKTEHEEL